jgi:hypothetical protein
MSLQHAAKHLAAHGRGPDTTLVHMSKDEVKSLNDIAMAHGGHLTVNPHTGLPEAGFLSRLLPTIAGAALAATGVGAPMAGLIVGGGYAAATGSLKKGLIAGLGAYGGAGIGSALSASGAATTPSVSLAEAAPPASNPLRGEFPTTPQAAAPTPSAAPVSSATSVRPVTADPNLAVSPFGQASVPTAPAAQVTPIQTTTVTPVNAPAPASTSASVNAPAPANTSSWSPFKDMQPNSIGTNLRNSMNSMYEGAKSLTSAEGRTAFMNNLENNPDTFGSKTTLAAAAAPIIAPGDRKKSTDNMYHDSNPGQQYNYEANATNPTPSADPYGREQKYFNQRYVARADGGPVEAMSDATSVGLNTGYPMADVNKGAYATPWQVPISRNVVQDAADTGVNPVNGQMTNFAGGGLSDAQYNLGGYSDGGRLLRGPGDGVSDSIPAVIGQKQPARLADGEFVVPARIVSELGNGSTEAGARKLYAMMDRIQAARGKTVGKGKVAKNSRADRHLPA